MSDRVFPICLSQDQGGTVTSITIPVSRGAPLARTDKAKGRTYILYGSGNRNMLMPFVRRTISNFKDKINDATIIGFAEADIEAIDRRIAMQGVKGYGDEYWSYFLSDVGSADRKKRIEGYIENYWVPEYLTTVFVADRQREIPKMCPKPMLEKLAELIYAAVEEDYFPMLFPNIYPIGYNDNEIIAKRCRSEFIGRINVPDNNTGYVGMYFFRAVVLIPFSPFTTVGELKAYDSGIRRINQNGVVAELQNIFSENMPKSRIMLLSAATNLERTDTAIEVFNSLYDFNENKGKKTFPNTVFGGDSR